MARQREEVLNVVLAQLVCDSGMAAAPENIAKSQGDRVMPDVIISVRGLRCAIEGKIGDVQDARSSVLAKAKERVDMGVAHIAIAVVYPEELREEPFSRLSVSLRKAQLDFAIVSESEGDAWRSGDIDSILADLRRSYQRLASDDVVERSVMLLRNGMSDIVNVFMSDVTAENLAEMLGVYEADADS